MLGAMQDWDLRVSSLLDHAAREHGAREIVSRWTDGRVTRSNWSGIRRDALRMVQGLRRLDIYPQERVATLAMNHEHHLAAWFGATGAGCVLHTLNPSLPDEQLAFIVNHAGDRVLLYDTAFQPLVDRMRPKWPTIEQYVCFDSRSDAVCFEDWIAQEDGEALWSPDEEHEPCMLSYSSGTTGDPRGVLYSHRSIVLHTLSVIQPACYALSPRSCVLPAVPMFHANNWGLPWASAAAGAKMVYSQSGDAAVICGLIEQEHVTHVAGVPSVWLGILEHLDSAGQVLPPLAMALSGGSAMPEAMIERLMRHGARAMQAWGMTETSPLATITWEPPEWDSLTFAQQVACKSSQGRAIFGSEVRVVPLGEAGDDAGASVGAEKLTVGALQVRGPWAVQRYFEAEEDAVGREQWLDTGDVARIEPDGSLRLTDRIQDLIKSGGDWISSVALENAAMAHPAVLEAAAIGVRHPLWIERPILIVVLRPGESVSSEDLRAFLSPAMPERWVPEAVEFVEELPHTGAGKISKKALRAAYRDYRLRE